MNPIIRVVIFAIILLGVTHTHSWSQTETRISGDFKNITFIRFVEELEKKSDHRFFFNPVSVDSLMVNINVSDKTLSEILDEVLSDTELKYAITQSHVVYITLKAPVATELPIDFFDNSLASGDSLKKKFDYSRFEEDEKTKTEKPIVIGSKGSNTKPTASIAGYVRNINSGEPVIGATVMIETPMIGVATDPLGYFSISLPKGQHQLKIRSIGMKNTERKVILNADGKLNIEMEEDVTPLKEIIVEAERDAKVMSMQMGTEKLDLKTMKQIPLALGEVDIIKAVLTLPGVQSVGEGTVGFNVRGGATDQNLILFNEAIIYNPSHLFGFFSAFNPDLLKNVELYKSGIPAEFGGRISSVLDISTREGNKKKFSGSGGISPITGRLALEGPIIKEKSSFLIGARSTYSDWLLNQIPSSELEDSEASFYDVNLNINHEFSSKDHLHVSGYLSKDRFKLQNDTSYSYSNKMAAVKWRHIFNNKFFAELGGNYSGYDYAIESKKNPVNAFNLSYALQQSNVKVDFNYFLNTKHTINFGAGTIFYKLTPGSLKPLGNESLIVTDILQNEQATESALYIGDQFELNPRLSLYAGIRYSLFRNTGPRDVFIYEPGLSKDVTTIIDTVSYPSGQKISTSGGPEVRLSARYVLSGKSSLKLSFNRMRQYLQMLSNTTAIAPTDIWKLSDPYIKPLLGDQFSIGYYHNVKALELSAEVYYKKMQNFLDYKGGAELILNPHIETDVINAEGKAYGAEFLIKKPNGKLNGWVSYTYSRSLIRTRGDLPSEVINRGEYYPSNYDKPHAFNFISNYKFNRRFSMSTNVTYSTGRPITLPLAKYDIDGTSRLFYSDRNQYRIPDYFRIDFGLNIEGNHKIRKLAHSSWNISVYNLTGRRNAYSVYFTSENGVVKGYKLSIFGSAIPTITYNFKF
jgi:TonB dependent receptor/CarboxypepD_reg-like domain/TonB-dependent Receptor Plug Domain